MKLILAISKNGIIGYNKGKNFIPWRLPSDFKFFKRMTENNTVIMGRTTFETLPFKDGLPNRKNIIITSNPYKYNNLQSLALTFNHITCFEGSSMINNAWCIGGTQLARSFIKLGYIKEAYITIVDARIEDKAELSPVKFSLCKDLNKFKFLYEINNGFDKDQDEYKYKTYKYTFTPEYHFGEE